MQPHQKKLLKLNNYLELITSWSSTTVEQYMSIEAIDVKLLPMPHWVCAILNLIASLKQSSEGPETASIELSCWTIGIEYKHRKLITIYSLFIKWPAFWARLKFVHISKHHSSNLAASSTDNRSKHSSASSISDFHITYKHNG